MSRMNPVRKGCLVYEGLVYGKPWRPVWRISTIWQWEITEGFGGVGGYGDGSSSAIRLRNEMDE